MYTSSVSYMKKRRCKILKIKHNTILFGKKNQDTSFVYKQNDDKSMVFLNVGNEEMDSYYQFIDSKFVDIIQICIPWIFEKKEVSFEECSDFLIEQNPLQLEKSFALRFYPHYMTKFASFVSLHSEKDYMEARDNYKLVEIQHGKIFVRHYPVNLSFNYVLMPYCVLSVKKINVPNEIEGNSTIKLKLIVKYKDKTAPTELGYELSDVLNDLSIDANGIYERITKIAIRLHDKYQEQSNYFGQDIVKMINKQVF